MRTTHLKLGLLAVAATALVLSGCATLDLSQPSNDQVSLVVGYLDMSDAPAPLDWISVKRLSPPTDKPYYYFAVDKGLFYQSYLEPGTYKMYKFGGQQRFLIFAGSRYEFSFPAQGKGTLDFQIKKPGVYFLGSFKYVNVQTGLFQPQEFEIKKVNKPTEQEALSMVLKYAGNTKWRARILKRLDQIGGPIKEQQ